jgi:periplasmic protein CpxP/Spy
MGPRPGYEKKRREKISVFILITGKQFSMKKMIAAVLITALFSTAAVAQEGGGGFARKTVPERVKEVMEKLTDFKLEKAKADMTDSIFTVFFTAQQKMVEDMRAGGGMPDREVMKEKRQKLVDERDTKLKTVFTEEQFKKWKEEIEPSMRQGRGQRQGGGGQ